MKCLRYFLSFGFCFLTCGCGHLAQKPKPPSASVSTPDVTVAQTGDAKVPARAEVTTQTTSLPLPAATQVTVSPQSGAVTYTLSRDSSASVATRVEKVEAPQAFTPPAPPPPPTPVQIAQGIGVRAFWIASLGCLLFAGLLAYTAHYLAAGACGLAAVALPVLAQFFSSGLAMAIGGALVAVAGAFWAAWHVIERRKAGLPSAGG